MIVFKFTVVGKNAEFQKVSTQGNEANFAAYHYRSLCADFFNGVFTMNDLISNTASMTSTVNAVSIPTPGSESARIAHETIEMGILFGAPRHLLQIEAVKNVERLTGKDFSNLLALSPYMDNIPVDEVMLEPSDIAKHYGLKGSTHDSAIINQVLAGAGLQFKNSAGAWQPAVGVEPLAQRHCWSKNGKSGYNYKWRLSGIAHILDVHFGYESGSE